MLIFIIECILPCVLLTFSLKLILDRKGPIAFVFDFPTPIIVRAYELGLIKEKSTELRKSVLLKKIPIAALLGIPLGFLVKYINHADTFLQGFIIVYGICFVVCVYDVLMDIVWFCNSKSFIIPGTEDLTDAYHDYMFHVRASLRGMLLMLPAAIIAGIVVSVITAY